MGVEKSKRQESNQRRRRSGGAKGGTGANWMLCDPEMLQYTITAVAQKGGALRLGYTRDGGAYAIGIYGDGDPYTEYISPTEDVNEQLRSIASDFGNVTGDGSYVGDERNGTAAGAKGTR